jgi:hypothetical protein
MTKLVFMLEEPSMRQALLGFLPRLLPDEVLFQIIPHEGKSDLERSLPTKLKAWREPGVRFVVIRDNDGGDCVALKHRLAAICAESGRPDSLVRIACQELEAWFLGDLAAVARAMDQPALARKQNTKKYRDPDRLGNAPQEMDRLWPGYRKTDGARRIGRELSTDGNRSKSFQVFVAGLKKLLEEPLKDGCFDSGRVASAETLPVPIPEARR